MTYWKCWEDGTLEEMSAFLVTESRVFNWPLGRSLYSFARSTRSTHSPQSLCNAPLCYECYVRSLHSQACSLISLTHVVNAIKRKKRVFVVAKNTHSNQISPFLQVRCWCREQKPEGTCKYISIALDPKSIQNHHLLGCFTSGNAVERDFALATRTYD